MNRRKNWIIIEAETQEMQNMEIQPEQNMEMQLGQNMQTGQDMQPEQNMEMQPGQNMQTGQDMQAEQNMEMQPGQQMQINVQPGPDELITLQECKAPAKQDHLDDFLESDPYKVDQGYITYWAETLPNF